MLELVFAAGLCVAIDGDTLRCGDARIRLAMIDAPEFSPCPPARRFCRYDVAAAVASKRHLQAMIAGKAIECKRRGRSYERVVAVCRVGGVDIGCMMIRAGHALEWVRYSGGAYRGCRP